MLLPKWHNNNEGTCAEARFAAHADYWQCVAPDESDRTKRCVEFRSVRATAMQRAKKERLEMSQSDPIVRLMTNPPNEFIDPEKMSLLSRWMSWFSCDDAIRETARFAAFLWNAVGDLNEPVQSTMASWLRGKRMGDALQSPFHEDDNECSIESLSIIATTIINLHDTNHLDRLRSINDRLFQRRTPPDMLVFQTMDIETRIARSMLDVIANERLRLYTSFAQFETLSFVSAFLHLSVLERRKNEYVTLRLDEIGQQSSSPPVYRSARRA